MEEIRILKKEAWKTLVKSKTIERSLKYLNLNIGSKSRKYDTLEMSNFLTSNNEEFHVETSKFIAKFQTHMVETVKNNFKDK